MEAVFQSPQLQDLGTEPFVLGIAQKLLQVFLRVNENSSRHVTENDTHSENRYPAFSIRATTNRQNRTKISLLTSQVTRW